MVRGCVSDYLKAPSENRPLVNRTDIYLRRAKPPKYLRRHTVRIKRRPTVQRGEEIRNNRRYTAALTLFHRVIPHSVNIKLVWREIKIYRRSSLADGSLQRAEAVCCEINLSK